MRTLISFLVFVFATTTASADGPRPSLEAQLEAMSKLHPFAGTWLGEGWFTLNGERTELVQGVVVAVELKGQVMTTRDIILRRIEPAPAPNSATYGVWSYDDLKEEFLFRSYYGASFRDYEMDVPEPGLLRATGKIGEGDIVGRLEMDVRDGVWRETAFRSMDGGETWTQNYGITMRRQANPLGDPPGLKLE